MKLVNIIFISVLFSSYSLISQTLDTSIVDINNIVLPITNDGNIGDIDYVMYDSIGVIYSAGHLLGGLHSDTVWANGVFRSERIEDYLSGKFDNSGGTEDKKFYVVRSTDGDFSDSWQQWVEAVNSGAYFYDGDNDGVYNPVDNNNNGIWDPDEDRPDLIGDLTIWDVFNDGKLASERRFQDVQPMDLEIKRTTFAYNRDDNYVLNNTIFFRYIILNSSEEKYLDSVYFGVAVDNDIGNYATDFTGSDTLLNSAFAYKKNQDNYFGDNPPSIMTTLLQGPIVEDEFSEATIKRGPYLGEEIFSLSSNKEMTAAASYLRAANSKPTNKYEVYNYLKGLNLDGETFSVRDDPFGNGDSLGLEADSIDPVFRYSGDPVQDKGWLNIKPFDWKMILSTGPFQLEPQQQQEIIFAYIVGRGNDPFHSVTVAKDYALQIEEFYESNFTKIPTHVERSSRSMIPDDFKLYQSYPNPFNPSTKIEYQLPQNAHVKLVVYNSLGQVVSTLVDQNKSAGRYSVTFNASNLPSGVYFYRIQAGDYVSVKKMLLMK